MAEEEGAEAVDDHKEAWIDNLFKAMAASLLSLSVPFKIRWSSSSTTSSAFAEDERVIAVDLTY